MNKSNEILEMALEKTMVKAAEIGAIVAGLGVFYILAKFLAKYIPEQYFLEIVVILLAVVLFLVTFIKIIIIYFDSKRKELYPKDKDEPVKENLNFIDIKYAIGELIEDMRRRGFYPDVIVGIDRGGAIVGGMLAKRLNRPLTTISSSPRWTISSPILSLDDGLLDQEKRDEKYKNIKKILLVDDMVRTGETMERAYDTFKTDEKLKLMDRKTAIILKEEVGLGPSSEGKVPLDFFVYETKQKDIRMPWDKSKNNV